MNVKRCVDCPFYCPVAIFKTAPEHVITYGSCRKLREDIYCNDPCNQILSRCPFEEVTNDDNCSGK